MTPDDNTDVSSTTKILDGINKILTDKAAPAVVGKPVFEKDLDIIPGKSLHSVIGKNMPDNYKGHDATINFGSKSDTAYMGDEVRMRLFNLKKDFSNACIQAEVMNKGQAITPAMVMETPIFKNQLGAVLKAYSVTDFANFVPTAQARFYFEEYEIPYLLANKFDQQPMDSATMDIPGDTGFLEGKEETDVATFTEQSTTQANYTVYSRNNIVHTKITEDLLSDSAPKIIDKIRKGVVQGIARAYERCLINGDTTGTPRGASHFDSDIAALALNATFSKAFKGIRRKAYDADALVGAGTRMYNHNGDTASKTLFENILKLMGKFATEKNDLLWIMSTTIETQVIAGAIPELFTAYAFGGLASNVTGKMPPIFGIEPLASPFMREDLNASGVYVSGGVLTAVALIKKSRFMNFIRQGIKVWAAPSLPSSDTMLMSAKMRHAWDGNPQTAEEASVVLGYNISK